MKHPYIRNRKRPVPRLGAEDFRAAVKRAAELRRMGYEVRVEVRKRQAPCICYRLEGPVKGL